MVGLDNIKEVLKQKGVTTIVGYSRKSREVSEEDTRKHSDVMRELADRLGLPITFMREDSSSETLNRPVFNVLREDIAKKRVRCLMIYRMDRVTRKTTDTERIIKEWAFHDLILIEAHREKVVDYSETLGIKLEAIMSDLYLEQAKIVLSSGRKMSVQLYGNHLGEPPLGYDYNKDTKKLDPNNQAGVITDIFDMYLAGHSTHVIAQKLNDRGVTTRTGQHFKGKGIWTILQNDKYKGVQTYGKQEWYKDGDGKSHCKNRDKSDWIVYEGAHEPIIPPSKFEKVQSLLNSNRVVPTGARSRKFSMTNIAKCGQCGWGMSAIVREYKNHTTPMFRSCYHKDYVTGDRCGNKGLKMDVVEEYTKQQIWEVVRPAVLKATKKLAKEKKSALIGEGATAKKALMKQQVQLTTQIDNLFNMVMDVGKSDQLIAKIKHLEIQLATVKEQIETMNANDPEDDSLLWVDAYLKKSEDLVSFPLNLKGMSDTERNMFYKKYVETVGILDGKITGIKFQREIEQIIGLVT